MNDGELSEMKKIGHPRGSAVVLDRSTKLLTSVSKAQKSFTARLRAAKRQKRERQGRVEETFMTISMTTANTCKVFIDRHTLG